MMVKRGRREHIFDAATAMMLPVASRKRRRLTDEDLTREELGELRRLARGHRFVKKVSSGQVIKHWLPIPEAAKVLGVTRRQVYALVNERKLRPGWLIWPGGFKLQWITRASVERYARDRYTK